MTPTPEQKPLPQVSPDNRPFFAALARRELRLPRCGDCGRAHYPPGPACPFCFSERLAWERLSGQGVVSTWVVVHKAWFAAFAEDIPYNVVQVELAEGPRITANLVDLGAAELRVGLPVEAVFDDVAPEMTMLRFRPLG